MTVEEALSEIVPVKPMTYIFQQVKKGKLSILDNDNDPNPSLEKCKEKISEYKHKTDNAKGDAEYWYMLGHLTYWKMAENVVLAANLNEGTLADVKKPETHGIMVMQAISNMEQYGIKIYNETNNLRLRKKHEKRFKA